MAAAQGGHPAKQRLGRNTARRHAGSPCWGISGASC
jgi:hypothetical protein